MLSIGKQGFFVLAWQDFLAQSGLLQLCAPTTVNPPQGMSRRDGTFGPLVAAATRAFQSAYGLQIDGVVGTATFRAALATGRWPAPEGYPLLQCSFYTPAQRGVGDVDWIVLHTMEVPEAVGMALEIAGRFAVEGSPRASAHFHVDDQEIIQGCLLKDVAWHAEGGNRRGVGIEHAGTASQRAEQWDDDYSRAQLELSAKLSADLCKRFGIPAVWLDAAALKAGGRGITDHAAINDAFNGGGGHRDVGAGFPRRSYIEAVQAVLA